MLEKRDRPLSDEKKARNTNKGKVNHSLQTARLILEALRDEETNYDPAELGSNH
jgi:hypothetical protein